MTNFNIENLQGKGITAEVLDGGKQYSTYGRFADAAGHPDAVFDPVSAYSLEGDVVQVLAKGLHGSRGYNPVIYVCMTKKGQKFLIGEGGVKIMEPVQMDQFTTDDLLKEIERRAFEAGFKAGLEESDSAEMVIVPEQTVINRDAIVAQAKEDVKALEERGLNVHAIGSVEGNETYRSHFYTVEFQVNADKRTVVALVRHGRHGGGRIVHRGIAKADPSDCFNEFIGKAIALRRALELSMRDSYTNAPKPEGKQSGDIASDGGRELRLIDVKEKYIFDETAHLGSIFAKNARVINDTARYN
jgi:hypothetical protein